MSLDDFKGLPKRKEFWIVFLVGCILSFGLGRCSKGSVPAVKQVAPQPAETSPPPGVQPDSSKSLPEDQVKELQASCDAELKTTKEVHAIVLKRKEVELELRKKLYEEAVAAKTATESERDQYGIKLSELKAQFDELKKLIKKD